MKALLRSIVIGITALTLAGASVANAATLAAPTLKSPSNNLFTNNTTPVFTWADVTSATEYTIQISADKTFKTTQETSSPGTATYTSVGLAAGVHYWRVSASDGITDGPWSAVRTFTIDLTAPAAPVLRSPAMRATIHDTTPTFTVAKVTGAVKYHFQVSIMSDFSFIVAEYTKATPSLTLPKNNDLSGGNTKYWWRVSSIDKAGNESAWSKIRIFTIK